MTSLSGPWCPHLDIRVEPDCLSVTCPAFLLQFLCWVLSSFKRDSGTIYQSSPQENAQTQGFLYQIPGRLFGLLVSRFKDSKDKSKRRSNAKTQKPSKLFLHSSLPLLIPQEVILSQTLHPLCPLRGGRVASSLEGPAFIAFLISKRDTHFSISAQGLKL